VRNDEERWFRVRGAITYETELFVQAATREEAEEVYWGIDDLDTGELLEERLVEVEECEQPLK
jgi:hypothetical protein